MKITFSKKADLHSKLIFNYEVEPNEENRAVQRQIWLIFIPTHASRTFLIMHKTINPGSLFTASLDVDHTGFGFLLGKITCLDE